MPNIDPKKRIIGLVVRSHGKLQVDPSDKKGKSTLFPLTADSNAQEGDVVVAEGLHQDGAVHAKVVRILGQKTSPGILSLISLCEQGLSEEFSAAALNEVKTMSVPDLNAAHTTNIDNKTKTTTIPALEGREDLRSIPLVTVDGADTRDRDDAIFAEKTADGGFHLIVAIADVSWYVHPGSETDKEAFERGNSTYFPDRVLPMLPEALSNGLCSLNPHENRACLAAHLWIDKDGNMTGYKFARALMNSAASLTYKQLQAAKNGQPDAVTAPLMDKVVTPLYEAYDILRTARENRGALDLEMPVSKVAVNDNGDVSTSSDSRLDSHKVIEEFMILANVAAASALEDKGAPCVYRIHSSPPYQDKPNSSMDGLRQLLAPLGLSLPAGEIKNPAAFKEVLEKVKSLPEGPAIIKAITRMQAKAIYDTHNIGHFGLALEKYAHFTSPIRRYADLLVHRSLVDAFNLGSGALSQDQKARINEMTAHITETEKLSARAERSAHDRFAAASLAKRVGEEFTGRVVGVTNAGLFVRLDKTGVDGLVPMRNLPDDFYEIDNETHTLTGKRHGRVYASGDILTVHLKNVDSLKGSIILAAANDNTAQARPQSKKTPPTPRKNGHNPN